MSQNLRIPVKSILTSLPVYAICLCHFARSAIFFFLLTNEPTYLSVFGFPVAEVITSCHTRFKLHSTLACSTSRYTVLLYFVSHVIFCVCNIPALFHHVTVFACSRRCFLSPCHCCMCVERCSVSATLHHYVSCVTDQWSAC
jgi:hypothetical protein